MKTNLSYIPTTDADKVIWLNNFTTKLAVHATTLGVTTAELSSVQKDNAMYQYVINMIESYRQYLANLTGYKNMLKRAVGQQHIGGIPALPVLATAPATVTEGIFDRISKLVIRIKATLTYTDNIGSDLGVIAPAPPAIDVATMKPVITVKLEVGRPHLKWIKGYSDAIDLYADHNDGNGFMLVGRLMRNEYMDTTPVASPKVFDEWQYKAIYVIADTQVGLYSSIVSVDVKKM
ncbi:MAG: hypothetical protein K0R26_1275 [Bacteroidota bacterium]|jgi:hypothetical protein|nr:hypothetical protein [Bacteroidota bacterium]